ncbi:MAG: chloride channel protein, partial [Puniceicoccales bacterium]
IGCRVLWASRKSFLPVVISALAVSWLATLVARMAVPDRPAYLVHWTSSEPLLLVVALVVGPLAGVAGYGFGRIVERTSKSAPQGRSILWTMPLCYLLLAALAIPFPLILGNGHALAENLVRREVPLAMVAMLVFAKPIATLLTVRAGATGGKLTPSLSTGAALGAIMAAGCALLFPVHAGMVALLGAGAFLAGSLRAPLTAGVLIIELSGARPDMWPMVALAVAGSWAVSAALKHKKHRQDSQRDPHCLE